jgi:thiosulfate dehydrogenase (quinone) large subunit
MPHLLPIFSPLFVLRLGLGINMLMHGLVRLPKLNAFATKMAAGFEGTFLPVALAKPFLLVLPVLEFLTGVLILLGGRWGRYGFMLCGLLLAALLFGTTLKEDWNTAGTQLIYVIATAYGLSLYQQPERALT